MNYNNKGKDTRRFGHEKYKNNERFVFKKYTDRGHSIFQDESHTLDVELLNDVVAFFDKSVQPSVD